MNSGQIPLSIDFSAAYAAADYHVGNANRTAFQAVTEKPSQKAGVHNFLLLRGDKAYGKTHLAHVFCETHGARLLSDADLRQGFASSDVQEGGNVAVDDVDKLSPTAHEVLFHLYNRNAPQGRILLTSSRNVADIIESDKKRGGVLSDWHSRLLSFQTLEIMASPPDDALLTGFLQKNFHDRQIYPKSNELNYILRYAGRDLAYLRGLIDDLHQGMLERGSRLSVPLIKRYI